MATVVTLEDVTPIPRDDGVPWVSADVQEAPSADGPWAALATFNLLPVDADPRNPAARSFTVNGVLASGWYRVIFKDAGTGLMLPTEPIHNAPDETQPFWPSVAEVAAKLRARTKDRFGNEAGTFTADTRPTFQQVLEMIQAAADDVTAETDTDIPADAHDAVKQLIALRAAMDIELSFFPEQVSTNRSPYAEYKRLFDEGMTRVINAVMRETYEEQVGEQAETNVDWTMVVPPVDWDRVRW